MTPADQHPHLILLPKETLAQDPYPDEPFQMTFPGYWQIGEDGVRRTADIAVRLNSADLADLKERIRAVELAYSMRVLRMSAEEVEALQRKEAADAWEMSVPPSAELLTIVLEKLRVA